MIDFDFNRNERAAQRTFMYSSLFNSLKMTRSWKGVTSSKDNFNRGLIRACDWIEEFTARSLSYDTDSIRAFSVTLRYLSTEQNPILHLWGLPFCFGDLSIPNLIKSLMWSHRSKARRRSGFPSWSWAGWEGQVCFGTEFSTWNIPWCLKVMLGDHEGPDRNFESCLNTSKMPTKLHALSYPQALVLEGFVISLGAIRFDSDPTDLTQQDPRRRGGGGVASSIHMLCPNRLLVI